jgi:hypothetical protein
LVEASLEARAEALLDLVARAKEVARAEAEGV